MVPCAFPSLRFLTSFPPPFPPLSSPLPPSPPLFLSSSLPSTHSLPPSLFPYLSLPSSIPFQHIMCSGGCGRKGGEGREEERRGREEWRWERGEREMRGREEKGDEMREEGREALGWAARLSCLHHQQTTPADHTRTHTHTHAPAHTVLPELTMSILGDQMTRWQLCVISIPCDSRQRQGAEQTPGLMRDCLLCNTSPTQQHLFPYTGLSHPASRDT